MLRRTHVYKYVDAQAMNATVGGAASTFAVLAATAVTDAGSSVLTGDLGISPGTSITGFPPGTYSGALHATDSVAAAAQVVAMASYVDLSTRVPTADLTGLNLGSMNLTAGVYKFTSSAQLTGTLTLTGSATDVFVFQIGSTLTTAAAATVTLAGGAVAGNVFWQVGSSATLGAGTTFKGSILALASITSTTTVGVTGSLVALTGAVTLDGGTVAVATATHFVKGPVIETLNRNGFSIVAEWTQTLATMGGTLTLEASNNYDPVHPGQAGEVWTTITGSNVTVSGGGTFGWNVADAYYAYVRLAYAAAAGQGTLTAWACVKD